jgi:hypothetical protein
MSLRGRKNLPVGSSISSWAEAPAILDDTASAFEDFILDGTAVRVRLDRIHRADPKRRCSSAVCGAKRDAAGQLVKFQLFSSQPP